MKFNFQTILMGIFGIGIVIGVGMFAGFIPTPGSSSSELGLTGEVTIWGPISSSIMQTYFEPLEQENDGLSIRYVQKTVDQINNELADAMASGAGPDLFFLSDDYVVRHKAKALPIPYEEWPRLEYQNAFVNQAGMYMGPEGIIAIPIMMDPLVMYYNVNMLSSAYIVNPPETWQELLEITPELTQQSNSGALQQSAIAMGTYDNVPYAKEILATIAMQAGSPMVTMNADGNYRSAVLVGTTDGGGLGSALNFYTSFARPSQGNYTWNANQRSARESFTSEDSALYIGYASELNTIRNMNPNLNFNVTMLPQLADAPVKITGSRMYGLAISRQSSNIPAAYQLAGRLTSSSYVYEFAQVLQMPPVRREVLAVQPEDPFMRIFYNSALIARGWWDPNPVQTETLFENLIEGTLSGVTAVDRAVRQFDSEIAQLLGSR